MNFGRRKATLESGMTVTLSPHCPNCNDWSPDLRDHGNAHCIMCGYSFKARDAKVGVGVPIDPDFIAHDCNKRAAWDAFGGKTWGAVQSISREEGK